jgi:hypothetical protein
VDRIGSLQAGAALVALGILLIARPAACIQDPSLSWSTIQTEHFNVNYHEGLEAVALRIAAAAEEAHERLAGPLGHEPKHRTEITVSDETDSANGWSLTVPFNQIYVWATAPNDMGTLQDYDDWYFGLIMHEYTHTLHIDTYGGIAKVVNAIFGKVYPPNNTQPRWILEGYAVFEESTKTTGGRLRSSQWDMMMRMAVLADHFEPIDVISLGPYGWPHGTGIYLYGSHFIQHVAENYGEDVLRQTSQDYGKSLVPYGVNRTIRKITGKTWPELYEEWFEAAKLEYEAQAEEVREAGLREGTQITDTGEADLSPRFSPDGTTLAWFSVDGHDRAGLYLLDLEGPPAKPRSLLKTTGQGSVAWTPDGEGLVFTRSEIWKNWYAYHDLFHVDIDDGSILRLTEGGRSRQPDISPGGDLLAYTINGAGESSLAVARAGPDPEPLILESAGDFSQVYSPRFSPDGRRVAYSLWTEGGRRDIHVLDIEGGRTEALTSGRSLDTGPVWDPRGRYLYFCSDRTGISNVYAMDLEDDSLWQVTNVISGAFQPDVSPDGSTMVYVGYHDRGYDLYLMELDPGQWSPAGPPAEDRPDADLTWK